MATGHRRGFYYEKEDLQHKDDSDSRAASGDRDSPFPFSFHSDFYNKDRLRFRSAGYRRCSFRTCCRGNRRRAGRRSGSAAVPDRSFLPRSYCYRVPCRPGLRSVPLQKVIRSQEACRLGKNSHPCDSQARTSRPVPAVLLALDPLGQRI